MIDDTTFFSERGTRDVNQDAIYVSARKSRGIFVAVDGMDDNYSAIPCSVKLYQLVRKKHGICNPKRMK